MPRTKPVLQLALPLVVAACASATTTTRVSAVPETRGALAQVYYWRAKPGKLEEYSRYITDIAEKIDLEAGRQGAFVSVTTYVSTDSTTPWTHMRVFVLRDSTQLRGLAAALDHAGVALEPDSVKRRIRGEYSATLRDRVGSAVLSILK